MPQFKTPAQVVEEAQDLQVETVVSLDYVEHYVDPDEVDEGEPMEDEDGEPLALDDCYKILHGIHRDDW